IGGSSLLATTVVVPNATLKTAWIDNNDGTYTGVYTAISAGTALKVSMKMADWDNPLETAKYDITAGSAAAMNSTISVNKTTLLKRDEFLVTINLKDSHQNAVMVSDDFLAANVVVPNATLQGKWTNHNNGTYTGLYSATTAGIDLKVSIQLPEWSNKLESLAYNILLTVPPAYINTQVNSHTFSTPDEIGTFPSTGFLGATFTIVPSVGNALDYNWSVDASWVSVEAGIVKFNEVGTDVPVTILAVPKSNKINSVLRYQFKLRSWFTPLKQVEYGEAPAACSSKGAGYSVVRVSDLGDSARREGALISEWGDPTRYTNAFANDWGGYATRDWMTDVVSNNIVPAVVLTYGPLFVNDVIWGGTSDRNKINKVMAHTLCVKNP
ncbi:invasin, partial [Salmonella enterica]|nr:invasin [Salmonella enterica]